MSGWVFLIIHRRYAKKDAKEMVSTEIKNIIGDDLIDFEIPTLNEFEESEGYLFLKCGDYFAHKQKIVKSKVFSGVLPSYDNPSYQTDKEIAVYRKSVEKKERPITIIPGCCVEIKKGYYEGLFGLVCDILPNNMYRIQFRLYTSKKYLDFHISDLLFIKNIYSTVKNPIKEKDLKEQLEVPKSITQYMENLEKIVYFNKIHRSKY